MKRGVLSFRRLNARDEDGLIRVTVAAENETIAATGEAYTSPSQLSAFAEMLSAFPRQVPSSAAFSLASGSCDIAIRLETTDSLGTVAINVRIEDGTDRQKTSQFCGWNPNPGY